MNLENIHISELSLKFLKYTVTKINYIFIKLQIFLYKILKFFYEQFLEILSEATYICIPPY